MMKGNVFRQCILAGKHDVWEVKPVKLTSYWENSCEITKPDSWEVMSERLSFWCSWNSPSPCANICNAHPIMLFDGWMKQIPNIGLPGFVLHLQPIFFHVKRLLDESCYLGLHLSLSAMFLTSKYSPRDWTSSDIFECWKGYNLEMCELTWPFTESQVQE